MITPFDRISQYRRERYMIQARYLIERGYLRDMTESEAAEKIYIQNPDNELLDQEVKGLISI